MRSLFDFLFRRKKEEVSRDINDVSMFVNLKTNMTRRLPKDSSCVSYAFWYNPREIDETGNEEL